MTGRVVGAATLLLAGLQPSAGWPDPGLAVPVDATVRLVGEGSPEKVVAVQLVARDSTGARVETGTLEVGLAARTRADLRLEPGSWRVQAAAKGYWSPEIELRVARQPIPIELTLWPASLLTGTLSVPIGLLPEQVHVGFRAAPGPRTRDPVPSGAARCPVTNRTFTCHIPAGVLDLRVGARGLIPEYYWGIKLVEAASSQLGAIRLSKGASVFGFVKMTDGSPPPKATRVELTTLDGQRIRVTDVEYNERLLDLADTPREGGQAVVFPHSSAAGPHGAFQIRRAPAGQYRLVATTPDGHHASAGVVIKEDLEARLPHHLVLDEPLALDVTVDPPQDPSGSELSVTLKGISVFATEVLKQRVPEDGLVHVEALSPGEYIIAVTSADNKWYSQRIDLEPGVGPIRLELRFVRVRGRVLLGKEPLAATVIFGGLKGSPSIQLESAATDGEFQGTIPQVERSKRWSVDVRAESPRVSRSLRQVQVASDENGEAWVDLELSDTLLAGRVIDDRGSEMRDAIVTIDPQLSTGLADAPLQLFTDTLGRFEAVGLPEGPVAVWAEASSPLVVGPLRSAAVQVELREGDSTPLELVVKPGLQIRGKAVTAGSGLPIVGALVKVLPAITPRPTTGLKRTDAGGAFTANLPPGTREVDVVAWAYGHALTLLRLPVVDDTDLTVPIEQAGGDLVLQLSRPWTPLDPGSSTVVLIHNGVWEDVAYLNHVSRTTRTDAFSAQEQGTSGNVLVIPRVSGGVYSVCAMPRQSFAGTLQSAVQPERCARGRVMPGRALAVEVPDVGS